MTRKIFTLAFAIFALVFAACSSGDNSVIGADGNVGTIINRPLPPSNLVLFPDFDEHLLESSLVVSSANVDFDPESDSEDRLWQGMMVLTNLNKTRLQRNQLEEFGETVAEALSDVGITSATDSVQTVTLDEPQQLANTSAIWEVDVITEPSHSDYTRYYFRNAESGKIQATYLVQNNESGEPVRGLFAFVNPSKLARNPGPGKRLTALAFDVTDATRNLMVMREELYHSHFHRYFTYNVHEQCDTTTDDCIGEYEEIAAPSPLRFLEDINVRISWNDATNLVCVGDIDYSNGTATYNHTYEYTGPGLPTLEDVQLNACTVPTAFWGETYTADFLPIRFEDAEVAGQDTASSYYVDGVSLDGWNSLTPETIDAWLSASGF